MPGAVHPNVIDPHVFYDYEEKLWMVYGSYSGGIFILEMDDETGFCLKNKNTYGKHLLGGNHSRIEAPYIQYNSETGYSLSFHPLLVDLMQMGATTFELLVQKAARWTL